MQEMFAAFNQWKEKFKANIVDMGSKLKPSGRVVAPSGVYAIETRTFRRRRAAEGRREYEVVFDGTENKEFGDVGCVELWHY